MATGPLRACMAGHAFVCWAAVVAALVLGASTAGAPAPTGTPSRDAFSLHAAEQHCLQRCAAGGVDVFAGDGAGYGAAPAVGAHEPRESDAGSTRDAPTRAWLPEERWRSSAHVLSGAGSSRAQAPRAGGQCTSSVAEQQLALAELYYSTGGGEGDWGELNDWFQSDDFCKWAGIVCTPDGNIKSLTIRNNALRGRVPDSIGALCFLEYFEITNTRLTALPESIAALSALTKLSVGNNYLTELPRALANLTALRQLQADRNLLSALPPGLDLLTSLTFVNVQSNQLRHLPSAIGAWTALDTLRVSGNQLTSLPRSLGNCTALKYLYASANQLTALPDVFLNLSAVLDLRVSSNRLTSLPPSIAALSLLNTLQVASNRLERFPSWIRNNTALWSLDASDNAITQLPASLVQLDSLGFLNVSANRLSSVPDYMDSMRALSYFYATDNLLADLPPSITNMPSLNTLDLSRNSLSVLPDDIDLLSGTLKYLRVDSNQLRALPDSVTRLRELYELSVRSNQLAELPHAIGNLSKLQQLYADWNGLTSLPDSVVHLESLGRASFAHNRLEALPSDLSRWTSLLTLDLSSNRISSIPLSIGSATMLKELHASNNALHALPSTLVLLTKLTELRVSSNELDALPEPLESLASLQVLDASNNRLSSLPNATDLPPQLSWLDVSFNRLARLPDAIGWARALAVLRVSANQLSSLPDSIVLSQTLQEIYADSNVLQGGIPERLGDVQTLRIVDLEHNEVLGGSIPSSMGDLFRLEVLNLGNCSLIGDVPLSFSRLSNLTMLVLSDNQLTSLAGLDSGAQNSGSSMRLASLRTLLCNRNRLQGTLPRINADLSVLNLALNRNLSGPFPPWLAGGYPSLGVLDLSNCSLEGMLPASVDGDFSGAFSLLDISGNELLRTDDGVLPEWLIQAPSGERVLHVDPTQHYPYECPALTLKDVPSARVVASKTLEMGCTCVEGYYGDPIASCESCSGICNAVCDSASVIAWENGTFPVFSSGDLCLSNLLGFAECGAHAHACTPSCTFAQSGTLCDEADWCELGYEGHLCAHCSTADVADGQCYYPAGDECLPEDGAPSRWLTGTVLVFTFLFTVVYNASVPGVKSGFRRGYTFFSQVCSTVNAPLFSVGLGALVRISTSIANGGLLGSSVKETSGRSPSGMHLHTGQIRCWSGWLGDELHLMWISLASPLLLMLPLVAIVITLRVWLAPRAAKKVGRTVNRILERDENEAAWYQCCISGCSSDTTPDDTLMAYDDDIDGESSLHMIGAQQWSEDNHEMRYDGDEWGSEEHASERDDEGEWACVEKSTPWSYQVLSCILFVLYETHYSATVLSASLLNCEAEKLCGTDTSRSFVQDMPWVQCYTKDYEGYQWTAWSAMAIYTVLIPICFAGLMWWFRSAITKRRSSVHGWLGFFYLGFKKRYWWFEGVWSLRRLLLALGIALIPNEDGLQTAFVILVLGVSAAVQHYMHPYVTEFDNSLEMSTILVLLCSYGVQQTVWTTFAHVEGGVWALLIPNLLLFMVYYFLIVRQIIQDYWIIVRNALIKCRKCCQS